LPPRISKAAKAQHAIPPAINIPPDIAWMLLADFEAISLRIRDLRDPALELLSVWSDAQSDPGHAGNVTLGQLWLRRLEDR
jgi:hypothetical protein